MAHRQVLQAGALCRSAEVLREVDAGAFTAEQLETILLELSLQFGVPVGAGSEARRRSGDSAADLRAALDRLADDALAAARDAQRGIFDQTRGAAQRRRRTLDPKLAVGRE